MSVLQFMLQFMMFLQNCTETSKTSRKGNILDNLLGKSKVELQKGTFTHVYDALEHLKNIVPVDPNNEMSNVNEVVDIIDAAKEHIENLHIYLHMSYRTGRNPTNFSFLDPSKRKQNEEAEGEEEMDSDIESSEYDLSVEDAQIIDEPSPDENHNSSADNNYVTEYIERRIQESLLARMIPEKNQEVLHNHEDRVNINKNHKKQMKEDMFENNCGEEMTIFDLTGMDFMVETQEKV